MLRPFVIKNANVIKPPLCSAIIDLAAEMLITLKTEAPVAITPAPLLFQRVAKTVIMYLDVLLFCFYSSLPPCFPSNLRFLSVIHFHGKEARIKRGDLCARFIIRKKRISERDMGSFFPWTAWERLLQFSV